MGYLWYLPQVMTCKAGVSLRVTEAEDTGKCPVSRVITSTKFIIQLVISGESSNWFTSGIAENWSVVILTIQMTSVEWSSCPLVHLMRTRTETEHLMRYENI